MERVVTIKEVPGGWSVEIGDATTILYTEARDVLLFLDGYSQHGEVAASVYVQTEAGK